MKIFSVGILLLFCILWSCNNNNNYKAPSFNEIGDIVGNVLIKDVLCTHIWSIDIIDSLLILNCQNTLDNKIFYIFNKESGEKIKTFGEIGNGPGELPTSFNTSIDKANKKIYAIGRGWNVSYKIDSILNSNTYCCDKKIRGEGLDNSKFIGHYKDSLLYSICNFRPDRTHRIAILKPNGDIIFRSSFLPIISEIDEEDTSYRYLFYYYSTIESLKPDASKIVLVTTCGLNMEIFDITEDDIKSDIVRHYIKPKYLKSNPIRNDGIIEGVLALSSTNKYIYALWTKDTESQNPKQLAVFNWKGEAVRRYNLNTNILTFAVESDDSRVYVVTKDEDGKLNIVKYELS